MRPRALIWILAAAAVLTAAPARAAGDLYQVPNSTAPRILAEGMNCAAGKCRMTQQGQLVVGSTTPIAGAQFTSSGTAVFQSTTTSATQQALQVRDKSGAQIFKVQQDGKVKVGAGNPSTALDVTGTINATLFTGDGSALTGVIGPNSTGTWTAPQYHSSSVNISSPTSSLVVSSTANFNGSTSIGGTLSVTGTHVIGGTVTVTASTFTFLQNSTLSGTSFPAAHPGSTVTYTSNGGYPHVRLCVTYTSNATANGCQVAICAQGATNCGYLTLAPWGSNSNVLTNPFIYVNTAGTDTGTICREAVGKTPLAPGTYNAWFSCRVTAGDGARCDLGNCSFEIGDYWR